jgi:hypothetical protein
MPSGIIIVNDADPDKAMKFETIKDLRVETPPIYNKNA